MSKSKIILALVFIFIFILIASGSDEDDSNILSSDTFKIIASTSTKQMDDEIIDYGKSQGIDIKIDHYGDLEIVDMLNEKASDYDAVWISNSMWLYMLNNTYLVSDSKSIVIDPVVLAINKNKAKQLEFVNKDIYNKDILNAIKEGKLNYIMPSVTKTNTGATSYLTFLNSLAGSPEVLTEKHLKDEKLVSDLKDLFKGVKRVSGDEDYLEKMYLKGNYDAMINYESSIISLNKKLEKQGKEPLYLIYPKDGVAINDMPFAYINNNLDDTKTKEKFTKIQNYLTSDKMISKMEKLGYRSWYGGTNENVSKKTFNPDWGIDTTKYLKDMKYPSKKVINESLKLYMDALRKPAHIVFNLDVSGSMWGDGIEELQDAMNYILDYDKASKDLIQFSDKDKITLVTFNEKTKKIYDTKYGSQSDEIIKDIYDLSAGGGTNIYDSSIDSLNILSKDNSDNIKTVILMTDGYSNNGSYARLATYYNTNKLDIPIYSITFGSSDSSQLESIANLTNGKVFDGKNGLKKAFAEVRSYN